LNKKITTETLTIAKHLKDRKLNERVNSRFKRAVIVISKFFHFCVPYGDSRTMHVAKFLK
jgi:hypothetical protein